MKRFTVISFILLLVSRLSALESWPVLDVETWRIMSVTQLSGLLQDHDANARTNFGATPLIFVSSHNANPEVLQVLLNAGADVNARDDAGGTAFMYAVLYNDNPEPLLALLLEAGADINAQDDFGGTALPYAAMNNQIPEAI